MTRRSSLWVVVACLAGMAVGLSACRPGGEAPEKSGAVTVFAAASLTESLQAVAQAWSARTGGTVTFNFDGSSRLANQIAGGAPADVFVSADAAWVDWLGERVPLHGRADLLGNTLVTVVPAGPSAITGPADLATAPRLALAGENVPAGRYARAALRATGAWDAVAAHVVSGDDVRTALAWVANGEADAAVVYRTDVRVEPRVREAFAFPADSHPPIVYVGAVVGRDATPGARPNESATSFLTFCRSAEARDLFVAAGFRPAP